MSPLERERVRRRGRVTSLLAWGLALGATALFAWT